MGKDGLKRSNIYNWNCLPTPCWDNIQYKHA